MAADREKFNNAIGSVKIPILILDNKWHRIFGKMNPTDEIKDLDLFPRFNANRYEQQLSAVYEELKKNKRTKDLKGLYK